MRWYYSVFILAIVALAICIVLTGCGSDTTTMPPEEVVQRFLVALEKGDYTTAQSYASAGEINPESLTNALPAGSYVSGEANIKSDGATATVTVVAPEGSIEERDFTTREMSVFLIMSNDGAWKIESITAK